MTVLNRNMRYKTYMVIGHEKFDKTLSSVCYSSTSKKLIRKHCQKEGFIPYVIISERELTLLDMLSVDNDIYAFFYNKVHYKPKSKEVADYFLQEISFIRYQLGAIKKVIDKDYEKS